MEWHFVTSHVWVKCIWGGFQLRSTLIERRQLGSELDTAEQKVHSVDR